MASYDIKLVDCRFVPATPDPDNHKRIECVVKCNPYEAEHYCDSCGFNPAVNAARIEKGHLVKGKDGVKRLVW